MKKGLALLLAASMAVSAFSSAAMAADLTAQEKFEALVKEGVFTGYEDGSAGLDRQMTRAEVATIIARLLDLDQNAANAKFTDLLNSEWAAGYIGAVTPEYMEGYGNGKFGPTDTFTYEQLAAVMVRVLDIEVDEEATVEGEVTDWAQAYVAAAVKAGIITEQTDYTVPAVREALVVSAYTAHSELNVPATIGINKVEATNASELTVTFNGPVDTEKATFEVKRSGSAVKVTETKFSDDKRSAVLKLESKLVDATYSVTLGGISNLDSEKATAEVEAQAEKVAKLEFVTASETVAQAKDVLIEFQAVNQYGKPVEGKSASNYEIRVSDRDIEDTVQNRTGETAFTIDTFIQDPTYTSNDRNLLRTGDRFSVTIIDDETRLQASKIFTIGDPVLVSKIELGDLVDKNGDKIDYLRAELNERAYVQFTAYDQYGMKVYDRDQLNDDVSVNTNDRDVEAATVTGSVIDDRTPFVEDVDGDDKADLQIVYTQDDTSRQVSKEVVISAYAGGSSATKTVKVATVRQPASIEIPAFSGTIADGDREKHIPIIVKDSNGDTLTAQEIKDNADKFKVYTSGAIEEAADSAGTVLNGIVLTGEHVGKLRVEADGTGSSKIELSLREKPEVKGTLNLNVSKMRYPNSVKISDALTDSILLGAHDAFKVKTYDQYGEAYEKNYSEDNYQVKVTLEAVGSASTGARLELPAYDENGDGTNEYAATTLNLSNVAGGSNTATVEFDRAPFASATKWAYWDKELKLHGDALGNYRVKFELLKDGKVVGDTLSKTVEVISGTASNHNLTYTVSLDKGNADNTILAVKDLALDGFRFARTVATASDIQANYTPLTKKVKVEAKDASGQTVGIGGSSVIQSVYSDNNAIVDVVRDGSDFYLVGNNAGTTNVIVTAATPKGTQSTTIAVKTVKEAPTVADIKFSKTSKGIAYTSLAGKYAWDGTLGDELKIFDQFGGEYALGGDTDTLVSKEADIFNLQFGISNKKWSSNITQTGDISINSSTGELSINNRGTLSSFTITVTAPSGKTASVDVVLN